MKKYVIAALIIIGGLLTVTNTEARPLGRVFRGGRAAIRFAVRTPIRVVRPVLRPTGRIIIGVTRPIFRIGRR